jgi:hypothetical protein
MTAIYRYTLSGMITNIELPVGATFRCVGHLHGEFQAWYETNPSISMKSTLTIERVATGEHIKEGSVYLGSVVLPSADEIWHFYQTCQSI